MKRKTKGGEQVDNNATERDPLYVAIGSRIKQIRKSKGMTQAALAHKVGIACFISSIRRTFPGA